VFCATANEENKARITTQIVDRRPRQKEDINSFIGRDPIAWTESLLSMACELLAMNCVSAPLRG
jgi:phosphoglucomutase